MVARVSLWAGGGGGFWGKVQSKGFFRVYFSSNENIDVKVFYIPRALSTSVSFLLAFGVIFFIAQPVPIAGPGTRHFISKNIN